MKQNPAYRLVVFLFFAGWLAGRLNWFSLSFNSFQTFFFHMRILPFTARRLALLYFIFLLPFSLSAQDVLLIYNARIVDVVTGKLKPEQAILVQDQKIKAIGSYHTLRKGVPHALLLDAKKKYIIPGLWDMHIHLEGQTLVEDNRVLLPMFFAFGITTVRDCASDLGETVLKWRDSINRGEIFGPTLFTAGLKLEGKNSIWKGDLEIANEEELNQMLNKLDSLHPDFIKITENTLHGDLFLKSITESHKRGYLVSGHVPLDLTIEEMLDAGFSSVEHASYLLRLGYDEADIVQQLKAGKMTNAEANKIYQGLFNQQKADAGFKRLGAKGLYVTPTYIGGRQLAFLDSNNHMRDSMMTKYLTKAYTSNYQWRIDRMKNETADQKAERKARYKLNTSQLIHMQQAGITILAGSDEAALNTFVYPGESLIDELHIFQEAGMKPIDILRSATINGARFLKKEKQVGSIDVGKNADLVLLDENPLVNIHAVTKIRGVYTRGRWLNRKALDDILWQVKQAKQRLDNSREK